MTIRTRIVLVAGCLVSLVVGFLTLRFVALRGADRAMQKIVACGWQQDSARLFLRGRDGARTFGPGWYVTYQHDDYPSCFPFHVSVSVTGRRLQQSPEDLDRIVEEYRKDKRQAQPSGGANAALPQNSP